MSCTATGVYHTETELNRPQPLARNRAFGAGFTEPGVEPWLPLGDTDAHNVAAQREDRGSTLHFTRDLIALRRAAADLTGGSYESLPAPDGVWAYRRGEGHVVVLNLSAAEATVEGVEGTIALATDRARDGEAVPGALTLAPSQGAVVKRR